MDNLNKYIIHAKQPLSVALQMLNEVVDLTLFVVNDENKLIGTLTDGDVRRGLLGGKDINDYIDNFMKTSFRFINEDAYSVHDIIKAKELGVQILPIVDESMRVKKLINFSFHKSLLPVDAVIMAGGRGVRLSPLTDTLPKPLLKVGDKPIIEHGIDWLIRYGIDNITISLNYMAEKIINYFGNGKSKGISISYLHETEMLGTIGSLSMITHVRHETVLLMNSDLLTNIDLEEFYNEFIAKNADMSVACIPYNVSIPYAIMDVDKDFVLALKEKPTITYYSNAGIYLIKKEHIKLIPKGKIFNATDFIETLIADNKKVCYYTLLGYWLDIGKMDDFNKAQKDIKHIKF